MPGYSRVFIALWFCYSFPFGARQQPPSQVTSVLFVIYGVFFQTFRCHRIFEIFHFNALGFFPQSVIMQDDVCRRLKAWCLLALTPECDSKRHHVFLSKVPTIAEAGTNNELQSKLDRLSRRPRVWFNVERLAHQKKCMFQGIFPQCWLGMAVEEWRISISYHFRQRQSDRITELLNYNCILHNRNYVLVIT